MIPPSRVSTLRLLLAMHVLRWEGNCGAPAIACWRIRSSLLSTPVRETYYSPALLSHDGRWLPNVIWMDKHAPFSKFESRRQVYNT